MLRVVVLNVVNLGMMAKIAFFILFMFATFKIKLNILFVYF